MRSGVSFCVFATLAALAPGAAPAFDFVRDGRICVRLEGVEASETAFAKAEFARVLDAVTGCGTNAVPEAGVISLSVDPSLGKGDTFRIIAADSFMPVSTGRADLRVGRDRARPSHADLNPDHHNNAAGNRLTIVGSNPESVGFAIFEVLERLGCRWYWPGPDGEYLPAPTKNLSLKAFEMTSTAAIPNRTFNYHHTRSSDSRWKNEFFAHQRMHARKSFGGHLFNWVVPADCKSDKEYFQKYPEQHALWKGKRVWNQHCYTSPETFKTFVDYYARMWDEHSEAEYMSLSPKDAPIYCTCETCKAKGDSSTLYFDFINRLVTALEKVRPGKKYRTIAYSFYWAVPKVKLHPAITFEYCMYNRCYMHPFGDTTCPVNPRALGQMAAWTEVLGKTPGIYGYHFDIWSSPKPMLAPMERVLQDEIKWSRDRGMGYWYTEYYSGWAYRKRKSRNDPVVTIREDTMECCRRFQAYALCRFLWNPDQDLEALKRDWCDRVYGPAADEMFAYLTALEDAWTGAGHACSYNNSPDRYADAFVSKTLLETADAAFAAAEKKLSAAGGSCSCATVERAKGEVALEKVWWLRWRDLRMKRANWVEIGRNPDPDRLAYLLDEAKPGATLYPWPENPTDNWTEWIPGKLTDQQKRQKSDGLLFGHHPRQFRGGPWVNYECSFDFRFAPEEKRKELELQLRFGGPRYGADFGYLVVNLDENGFSSCVYIKHGTPVKPTQPFVKRKGFLGDRQHRLVARLADTKLRVTVDGEVLFTVDVPIGAGFINMWSRASTLEIANLSVRKLETPTQEELAGYKARKAGKKATVDGTGRIIYE